MNHPQVNTVETLEDRVRERIRATFVELIPQEQWSALVGVELHRFTQRELPELVKKAAAEHLQTMLKAELDKPEWRERWTGNHIPDAGPALAEALRQAAPEMAAALFAGLGNQIINALRNGAIRMY